MDSTPSGGLATRFTAWVKKPFSGDMDALHWFLFLGLVLVAVFLWSRIMFYVKKGVEV
jgi:hypothetical protein